MIEQEISLESGRVHKFVFTHDTVRQFERLGGRLSQGVDNLSVNMDLYIRAMIIDEGSISTSKAEKIFEEISKEYDIVDVYGVLANKHSEVFIGGDNDAPKKKLSK